MWSVTYNEKIEPMLIHPTKCGYRNNKNKKNRKTENNGNNGKGTQGKNDWNGNTAINAGNAGGDVRYSLWGCNTCDIVSLILEYRNKLYKNETKNKRI